MRQIPQLFLFILIVLFFVGCASPSKKKNPYEDATSSEMLSFLKVHIPFEAGTRFTISQGAFGTASHSEPGNEYSWDFDVPYGTDVTAVADGKVIEVWQPEKGGECDPRFASLAHNLKIEHRDGTVAQYVHIEILVKNGDVIKTGQRIAKTAKNGWICQPQLHFGVYKSKDHLYSSDHRQTVPLLFIEIPGGRALPAPRF